MTVKKWWFDRGIEMWDTTNTCQILFEFGIGQAKRSYKCQIQHHTKVLVFSLVILRLFYSATIQHVNYLKTNSFVPPSCFIQSPLSRIDWIDSSITGFRTAFLGFSSYEYVTRWERCNCDVNSVWSAPKMANRKRLVTHLRPLVPFGR